jgi:dTDP-4-dehydrorhamnose 3,5-epimerase
LNFVELEIPGVIRVEPRIFGDPRGYFFESYHAERYASHGIPARFVQDNESYSKRGILRGLHAQSPFPQGKLVRALAGEIYDVVVDARLGSPAFGRWLGMTLSGENKHQLYVPPGCLHGFCVVSEAAQVEYKCTELYHPEAEFSVRFDDPEIGVRWPIAEPLLSDKDRRAPCFSEVRERLIPYAPR